MVNTTAIVLIVAGAILLFCYKRYLKLSNEDSSEQNLNDASVPTPVPNCSVLSEKQLFLRNRLELGSGENSEKELPLSADLLLISIIDQMKLGNMGKAKKMLIKCGSTQEEITDEYKILSFEILFPSFLTLYGEIETTSPLTNIKSNCVIEAPFTKIC